MKLQSVLWEALLLAGLLTAPHAAEPLATDKGSPAVDGGNVVINGEIDAILVAEKRQERISGRVSIVMLTTKDLQKRRRMQVTGFNVLFSGVAQDALGGPKDSSDPLGVVGYALEGEEAQYLEYDAGSRRVSGQLRLFMDASWLGRAPVARTRDDWIRTPTVPALLKVDLVLDPERPVTKDFADGLQDSRASLAIQVTSNESFTDETRLRVPRVDVRSAKFSVVRVQTAPRYMFEVVSRLCLQPVGIWVLFPGSVLNGTGAGLAFGEPAARREWRKADILFEIRDSLVLFTPQYRELSEAEASALRNQVDVDDCIEIFFVNSLQPDELWGGGITFGAGTASASIISTDDNARHGIDRAHLAHEIGHVLRLGHPGEPSPDVAIPDSGTVMCPSGFKKDNPHRNSLGNATSVRNPLLTFDFKIVSAGPDCDDSADCGACPP